MNILQILQVSKNVILTLFMYQYRLKSKERKKWKNIKLNESHNLEDK